MEDSDDTARGTVTRLLASLDSGNEAVLDEVFPLVYTELRDMAHRHRRKWQGDSTIGTTALVNEAYLRLVDAGHVSARTRVHFLRVASRAMRQILCNYGRDQRASKRGGAARPISLDAIGGGDNLMAPEAPSDQLGDLAEALDRLEENDKRLSDVVECRFFGGLSIDETADALGISAATVKRDWLLARAWLYREMNPQ